MLPSYCREVRSYTLAEANAELPRVRNIVERIRVLVADAKIRQRAPHPSGNGPGPSSNGRARAPGGSDELRTLVEQLNTDGIVLRDPERGLIDFPARSPSGRDYLLCWLPGEDEIGWWHWPEAGFAGRTPITEPPD